MNYKIRRQRDSNQNFDNFATLRSKSFRNILSTPDKGSLSEGRRKSVAPAADSDSAILLYPLPLGGSKTKSPRLSEFQVHFFFTYFGYPDYGHCLLPSPRLVVIFTAPTLPTYSSSVTARLGFMPTCPTYLHFLRERIHYMTSALKGKGEQVCPYYGGLRVFLTPCCGRSCHAETEELGIMIA